jgi:hypothetical protein
MTITIEDQINSRAIPSTGLLQRLKHVYNPQGDLSDVDSKDNDCSKSDS